MVRTEREAALGSGELRHGEPLASLLLVDNTACMKYPRGGNVQAIIFEDVYARYWCLLSLSRVTGCLSTRTQY